MQLAAVHIRDDVHPPMLSLRVVTVQLSQTEMVDKESAFIQGWFLSYSLMSHSVAKQRSTARFLKRLRC